MFADVRPIVLVDCSQEPTVLDEGYVQTATDDTLRLLPPVAEGVIDGEPVRWQGVSADCPPNAGCPAGAPLPEGSWRVFVVFPERDRLSMQILAADRSAAERIFESVRVRDMSDVTVPDVSGLNPSVAWQELLRAGLSPEFASTAGLVPGDRAVVTGTTPLAGDTGPIDGRVLITYRRGRVIAAD